MKYVLMYGKSTCRECLLARELLESRGIPYAEVDVTGDREMTSWLERTTGRTTVPQLFLGDEAIGGYVELAALDADGSLNEMLR